MIFSFYQFRSVLSRVQLIRRAVARCFLVIVIKSKRCAVFRHYGIGFLRHGRNRDCTKK